MSVTKRCPVCDAKFETNNPRRRYCDIHKNQGAIGYLRRRELGMKERQLGAYPAKPCAVCCEDFWPTTGSAKYCSFECKLKASKKTDEEASAARSRRRQNRHRHKHLGWDPSIYAVLVERDGELCRICKTPPLPGYHLAIDHNHVTGLIRGLLCIRCNMGIGYFRENVQWLNNAVSFLETAEEVTPASLVYSGTREKYNGSKDTKLIDGRRVPIAELDQITVLALELEKRARRQENAINRKWRNLQLTFDGM